MINDYEVTNIEFNAKGVILCEWLYCSKNSDTSSCMVMAHDYNCIKELYLDKYAEVFAKAGHTEIGGS